MKEISPRNLTNYYVGALVIVAGLTSLCHIALIRQIELSSRSAAIINISGRQRMLSQRIAGMTAEYRLQVPGARESLLNSTSVFEKNLQELLDETTAMPRDDKARNALLQLYLDGPQSIQAQSQQFLSEARVLANTPADSPAIIPLSEQLFAQARSPLLDKLEAIVSVEQKQSEDSTRSLEAKQDIMLWLIFFTLTMEALVIFRPMVERITLYSTTLMTVAATDPLTGMQNRRAFLEWGDVELIRARRYHRPLSLLMLDVDHFKSINDTYGHGAGDLVLSTLAENINQTLRSIDRSGRIGGEEFAILLPETPLVSATLVAERIRVILAALEVAHSGSVIRFTVSIGVSQIASTVPNLTEALVYADRALYRAKARGRNCVVIDTPAISAEPATAVI